MEELINNDYLIALSISWIVGGWIHQVKAASNATYDFISLYDTPLYAIFTSVPFLATITSLVINIFLAGFLSTLCYIGILIAVQLVNINILFRIYLMIFGYSGVGAVVPMIGVIPSLIWLFVVQFA